MPKMIENIVFYILVFYFILFINDLLFWIFKTT